MADKLAKEILLNGELISFGGSGDGIKKAETKAEAESMVESGEIEEGGIVLVENDGDGVPSPSDLEDIRQNINDISTDLNNNTVVTPTLDSTVVSLQKGGYTRIGNIIIVNMVIKPNSTSRITMSTNMPKPATTYCGLKVMEFTDDSDDGSYAYVSNNTFVGKFANSSKNYMLSGVYVTIE